MYRGMLILYLVFAMGAGPRVCCVMGDVLDAGANLRAAMSPRSSCCETHSDPSSQGRRDHVPGPCHNLSRDGIGAKSAPPMDADAPIAAVVPRPNEGVAESIGNNAFAHLEARDMLCALHVLRC